MTPRISLRLTLVLSMIAAGTVPMLVTGVIVARQAGADLERTTYERLSGDVAGRAAYLQDYVETVVAQAVALAENPTVVEATRLFDGAFGRAGDELGRAAPGAPVQQSVARFYEREFLAALTQRGQPSVDADDLLPASRSGRALQYLYIADNDSPLGEKDALDASGAGLEYDRHHARFHPVLRSFQERFELYDVFLIGPERADVVYSVFKEIDYATSLETGPHRRSGLAEAARRALELPSGQFALIDFSAYLPSYNAGASFVGTPVHDGDRLVGALVFQMPAGHMNEIVAANVEGLGETGESLLVGADGTRRSRSRFAGTDVAIPDRVEAQGVDAALAGRSGVEHEEFHGEDYLTAYAPVSVGGVSWALITRMRTDEALASVYSLARTALLVAAVSMLLVVAFAAWLGARLYRTLGGDPSRIRDVAERMGAGDLRGSAEDVGATGAYAAIVATRDRLREVLHDAGRIAAEVSNGAAELSEGNQGLSERTEQQASNLEETASSTEELTSTVKQNAENARTANTLAVQTRQRAAESGDVAVRAVGAMQDINASSERIADIIGVIDEIAFQTNLLALNAAVEAARAGEQGRGFAVVASEVRQLAGRSASAAKEIKDLIEDSVVKVKDGTELVQRSGTALEEIVGAVANLTDIVGQITVASEEQSLGIEQINQALVHMDSVTQQNTALVEEAAQTSRTISDQAALLSRRIGYFSDGEGEAVIATVAAPAAPRPDVPAAVPAAAVHVPPAPRAVNVVALEGRQRQGRTANRPPEHDVAPPAAIKRASGSEEFWEEF